MNEHTEAIELIEAEIAGVEQKLSSTAGGHDLVERKRSLLASLRLLRQLSGLDIAPKAKILTLPFPRYSGHFSEFRLIDDNETENKSTWSELEIDGEPVRAFVGDILILNSEKR